LHILLGAYRFAYDQSDIVFENEVEAGHASAGDLVFCPVFFGCVFAGPF
jgi:hypothetical protein